MLLRPIIVIYNFVRRHCVTEQAGGPGRRGGNDEADMQRAGGATEANRDVVGWGQPAHGWG